MLEFLSSLYSSTIIPQGSHILLKRYIRAKKLDSPGGKKVVRQDLLYLTVPRLWLRHNPSLLACLQSWALRGSASQFNDSHSPTIDLPLIQPKAPPQENKSCKRERKKPQTYSQRVKTMCEKVKRTSKASENVW